MKFDTDKGGYILTTEQLDDLFREREELKKQVENGKSAIDTNRRLSEKIIELLDEIEELKNEVDMLKRYKSEWSPAVFYSNKNKYIEECDIIDALDWDNDLNKWTISDEKLDNLPATDVVLVVHGKWIMKDKGAGVCSNCNRQDHIDPLSKYCRYCGAKMDLEER